MAEPLDVLSSELGAVADRITMILPWGSLLRSVAVPEVESLGHIANLCLPGARVEIVFSYDQQRDAREGAPLGAMALQEEHIKETLPGLYEQAGLRVFSTAAISQQELAAYETTWAKRLAFGRARQVWQVRAGKL